MQKALTQMNVQLDTVLSDLVGKTGQAILRAIVAGERDGDVGKIALRDCCRSKRAGRCQVTHKCGRYSEGSLE